MCDQKVAVTEGFVYPKSVTADNHSKERETQFINNGGTRDLKRNEPRRDCNLSLSLVAARTTRSFQHLSQMTCGHVICVFDVFVHHATCCTSGP